MILYCQGCDFSFTEEAINAPAFSLCCPECGSAHFATWKRGEAPSWLRTGVHIPVPNANACAGVPQVTIYDTTGAAPQPYTVHLDPMPGCAPGAAAFSVIPFSGGTP